jgi:hypothetical protein
MRLRLGLLFLGFITVIPGIAITPKAGGAHAAAASLAVQQLG